MSIQLCSSVDVLVAAVMDPAPPRDHASSPIYRLPAELLVYIFLLCCWSGSDSNPKNIHSRHFPASIRVAFTIASVTSYWRQLALGTGLLWNRIHIAPRPNKLARYTSLLNLLLERSSQAPLEMSWFGISESINGSGRVTGSDAFEQLWSVFQHNLSACRSVHLLHPPPDVDPIFDSISPRLEQLSIVGALPRRRREAANLPPLFHGTSDAPCLSELHLSLFNTSILSSVPYSRITCASFVGPVESITTPGVLYSFLGQCKLLTQLRLSDDYPELGSISPPSTSIALPRLEGLQTNVEHFPDIFAVPNLRELVCENHALYAEASYDAFPKLHTVCLLGPRFALEHLVDGWVPSKYLAPTRVLNVMQSRKSSVVLKCLRRRAEHDSSAHAYFPFLEVLSLADCDRDVLLSPTAFSALVDEVLDARPALVIICHVHQFEGLDTAAGEGSRGRHGSRLRRLSKEDLERARDACPDKLHATSRLAWYWPALSKVAGLS